MSNEAQDPVPWVKHEVFSSNSNSKLVSDPLNQAGTKPSFEFEAHFQIRTHPISILILFFRAAGQPGPVDMQYTRVNWGVNWG